MVGELKEGGGKGKNKKIMIELMEKGGRRKGEKYKRN